MQRKPPKKHRPTPSPRAASLPLSAVPWAILTWLLPPYTVARPCRHRESCPPWGLSFVVENPKQHLCAQQAVEMGAAGEPQAVGLQHDALSSGNRASWHGAVGVGST